MDVTLERILSLLPHKPDGKLAHGAGKELGLALGYKSGNIVSEWISGRKKSYREYLYEIAAKYNVSVEWLKGETDDPTPKPPVVQLDRLIENVSREELAALIVRASELLRDK